MTEPTREQIALALRPLLERVRTDVTWIKKVDPQTGKKRARLLREPLDEPRLRKHLNGGPARGVALMEPGTDVTRVAVLDLDSHEGETPWGEMACVAANIGDVLQMCQGCEAVAFRSGGGAGIHLYLLWEEWQDSYSVQQMLEGVLAACGLRRGAAGVAQGCAEIFPKQNSIEAGRFGNQVFLPMAGESEPLEYEDLSGMLVPAGRAAVLRADWWRLSLPVDKVEKPARVAREIGPISEDGVRVMLDALGAIVQAVADGKLMLGRDDWRDLVYAIHSATGGSDQGYAIALQTSMDLSGWDEQAEDILERLWQAADAGKEGGVTEASIRHLAREVGWTDPTHAPDVDAFPVVEAPKRPTEAAKRPGADEEGDDLPAFDREKSGVIRPTMVNAVMAMRRPDVVGMRIGHDDFRAEITVAAPGTDDWQPITDADLVRLRMAMERCGFKAVTKEMVREAMILVAAERHYDSAQLWLSWLKWDGVPRVETFLSTYLGTSDTPYTRAVSRYIWTALAGRVIEPGVKADMVPIFEGSQGIRKSTAIEAMSPAPEFFVEIDLSDKEEDTVRKLRGSLVGEIAELSGLHTRAMEGIKKFVARRIEKWVPKYKEFTSTFARRLLFIGTTNKSEILADETGNRRWLPVHITRADTEAIVRDRGQLWAEGAAMFGGQVPGVAGGVSWQDAELLAVAEHGEYMVVDAWEDAVGAWLERSDAESVEGDGTAGGGVVLLDVAGGALFTTADVLAGALNLPKKSMDRVSSNRVCAILRGLGYTQKPTRQGKRVSKMWHRVDV